MDFGKTIDNATAYFQGHPLIGAAVVLAVIVFVYLRVKLAMKLVVAAAIIIAVLYVGAFLVNLTEIGIHDQDKLLDAPSLNSK